MFAACHFADTPRYATPLMPRQYAALRHDAFSSTPLASPAFSMHADYADACRDIMIIR